MRQIVSRAGSRFFTDGVTSSRSCMNRLQLQTCANHFGPFFLQAHERDIIFQVFNSLRDKMAMRLPLSAEGIVGSFQESFLYKNQ